MYETVLTTRLKLERMLPFIAIAAASAPSVGYCNTMGTATTMNSLAEALGMQLPGAAAIPAPYRERGQMAYETGRRIVDMVHEDLRPADIMTREAFENAIVAAEASLQLAPAQPRTWLRIAQARSWLRYPPEQVIDALKMAIFSGRVEPSMLLTRLALGLAYLPRMDGEGQAMMRDQVLLAWQLQPRELARALKAGELRLAGFVTLLAGAHGGQ